MPRGVERIVPTAPPKEGTLTGPEFYAASTSHDTRLETHVITGVLEREVTMNDWNPTTRLFTNKHLVPPGTRVRIVMVSRLGDLGITDDLTKQTGYGVRVQPEDLSDITQVKV